MWKGGGQGCKNGVMVTLGTGVGGGVIINGSIIGGVRGAGGEIGHMKVSDTETDVCGCGKCGCLEQYASATGIVRVANDILEESQEDSKMRHVEKLSAKNVLDFYKEGDALAVKTMEKVGDILGSTLAVFACVTDPEAIVIGGGVSKAGKLLQTVSRSTIRNMHSHPVRVLRSFLQALEMMPVSMAQPVW